MSTATGTRDSLEVLLPSKPLSLSPQPQQYALPSATAHEWNVRANAAVTVFPASTPEVSTATGTDELLVVSFPS